MSPKVKWQIVCFAVLLWGVHSLYSPYYRRCRVNKTAVDNDAVPIEELQIELTPNYYEKYRSVPIVKTELEIKYKDYSYYFHEFIDAGGSGEVYLVEDAKTGEGKVAKRFYKERPHEFSRENYIMTVLNYPIEWNKYCEGFDKCPEEQTEFNTVAIYPYKETIVLRSLEFDGKEAPLVFYKLLKEMDKCHKAGIVHNDIKMGNVLINSIGLNFKFYELQLIDWNLAKFYYRGMDQVAKRGTVCYYSPQEMFRTIYITPARDIWSLGIAMYTYYTNQKPFSYNCKKDNLKAIISLVGAQKILQVYKKYRMNNIDSVRLLNQLQVNIHKYPQTDLYTRIVKQNREFYTKELVDVFKRMLEPDPQKRATAEQLMRMNYFRHITALPEMFYYRDKKKNNHLKQSKRSINHEINDIQK